MRRTFLAVGLSLVLVMTLATVASAGPGKANAYGARIKACTGLTYGQLMQAVRASEAGVSAYTTVIDVLDPAWGAKRVWGAIEPLCDSETVTDDALAEDAVAAGFGEGKSYGKRIRECTTLSYGQLRKAARLGTLPIAHPEITAGLKPAWGAKRMWAHIVTSCPLPAGT